MNGIQLRVLVYGEILWDIINGRNFLGGAPLNFAAHAVRCGLKASIISGLGKDDLGYEALSHANKMGVDTRLVQKITNKNTGTVIVTLNNGQPNYKIKTSVAFDFINSEPLKTEKIRNYNAFYFGSLIQRSIESRSTLYYMLDNFQFDNIFYDVNLRKNCYSKETVEKSLSYCTILKVNDDEVLVLSKMLYTKKQSFKLFAKEVINNFPQIELVIMTAGEKGCMLYQNHQFFSVKGVSVEVKDTVGAGDSFSAAFLSTYLKTNSVLKAAKVANLVGGFVASSNGAIPDYSEEITNLF